MGVMETDYARIRAASEFGSVCAIAAGGQRDLQACAARYPTLFPPKPFDATLFGTISQANAFSAPGLDAYRLRVANRAALWGFGVDWQIDYLASATDEVDDIVRRSLEVADGATPAVGDELTKFLVVIRDDLADTGGFAALRPMWREELRRMLAGMSREWTWRDAAKRGAALPSFDDYVDNADNLGSSFVNLSHWILTGDGCSPDDMADATRACRAGQQVLRLLNDLGTYDRDVAWGDLNALMLGLTKDEVAARIALLVRGCQELTAVLRSRQPALATFIERQIGFCMGFYRIADYWGEL